MREDTGKDNADVLPLILYSDATTLSQSGTVSAWPIYMTLANIPLKRRKQPGCFQLLGLIPPDTGEGLAVFSVEVIVSPLCDNFVSGLTRLEKQKVFADCLNLALEPLKRLSEEGFFHKGRWLYPLVYSYVADHPEGSKVYNFRVFRLFHLCYSVHRYLSHMGLENVSFLVALV